MTKFADLMKEIEAEAEAEGPEAVAELKALHEHYAKLREADGLYEVSEHLSGSVDPEPTEVLKPIEYNGWKHHPKCIGMAKGKGTGYCSELGCDVPPGTPPCTPDPMPETTIEALRLIALLVPHDSQSYEIAAEHIKRLEEMQGTDGAKDALEAIHNFLDANRFDAALAVLTRFRRSGGVLQSENMSTFGLIKAWEKEYDVIIPGACPDNALRELTRRLTENWEAELQNHGELE